MSEIIGVFVYGTLKSGERNAGVVSPLSREAAYLKTGWLYHLPEPAAYPALYLASPPGRLEDGGIVYGELLVFYRAADDLRLLDRLEGYRPGTNEYNFMRSLVSVICGGWELPALVYHFPAARPVPFGGQVVSGGNWRETDFS